MTESWALMLPHLRALKAQVDALVFMADMHVAMTAPPGTTGCPSCGAEGERVRETPTLDGTTHRRCAACGAEWDG